MENTAIHGTAQDLHVSPGIFLELNPTEKFPEIALWRKTTQRLIGMKFPNFTSLRLGLYKKTDPLQLEIDSFIRQVRDNKETLSNALDALNVVLVCDAARRSIRTGRKVKLAPWRRL
jgi:predicted dehydrogenase